MSDHSGAKSVDVASLSPSVFGVVTALPKEFAAMRAVLDESQIVEVKDDPNDYAVGTVTALDGSGTHRVVVTLQKKPANNSAAIAASHLLGSFRDIKYVLMVGIAGGVPHPRHPDKHVRLGDIVVSNHFGVVQYDNVKLAEGAVEIRDSSSSPSSALIGKANLLESEKDLGSFPWEQHIAHALVRLPGAVRPDASTDRLYTSSQPARIIRHPRDPNRRVGHPRVHFGRIASANVLLKDPRIRDALRDRLDVRAVEMEGSGVADGSWTAGQGYLVIRGICDYCDPYKNDTWQAYAAVVAAAYARALIEFFPAPLDPLKEEALAEARTKLEDAESHSVRYEFEAAANLCEEARDLAETGSDLQLEGRAHLGAARNLAQQLWHSSPDDAGRIEQFKMIEDHVAAAERLGSDPVRVAAERLLLARVQQRPTEMLRLADDVARLADPNAIDYQVEALSARLEALSRLGQEEKVLALRGEVERLLARAVGDPRLALGANWLAATCHTGTVLTNDVEDFVGDVKDLLEQGTVPRTLAVHSLGEIAAQFNRAGRLDDTLTLLVASYDIAAPAADAALSATIALQTAELAAELGEGRIARLYLGRAEEWCEKHKPAFGVPMESWVTLRVSTLFARGRTLARLAAASESTRDARETALAEAHEALGLALTFTDQERTHIKGNAGILLADIAFWSARVAESLGRLEEAAKLFCDVRSDTAMAHPQFSFQVGMEAWLREAEDLRLAGHPERASDLVKSLLTDTDDSDRPDMVSTRARAFDRHLDDRELPTIGWLRSQEARDIALVARRSSLREAVAAQVSPVVSWWEEWHNQTGGPESELLDAWGRGGFLRVAAAVQAKPHDAIAVDVFSVDEIRSLARMLCPLFDTVIVKWKGQLGGGMVMVPLPTDIAVTGGHGYEWTSTRIRDRWAIAVGWANPLPRKVTAFLAGEASALFRGGRLLVLPAPLVGCTQSAVGWTDDCLANVFLAGVFSVGRKGAVAGQGQSRLPRVLDLAEVTVPFIDGIELSDLASVLDETAEWALPMQSTLRTSIDDLAHEKLGTVKAIESQFRDASRYLQEKFENMSQKLGTGSWRVVSARGDVSAESRPLLSPGREPITDMLRALSPLPKDVSPWVPYWRLESFGGYLDWTCPVDNPSRPDDDEQRNNPPDLQGWLYPGTSGVGWRPMVRFA
ncbi:hypothetical protein E4N62_12180 [Streptomyces sp. MNU76]|uniref:phosphorylase family protein n=1 Tax=Streptomyces sp. MNU76 TaxID=2560026 RepID=UPI001E28FEB2|nr:hypothetical protein [Streptomyces sp. MNU76]MCC9705941.1 hypothetical protein [Streptomyces sp. MNU76]